MPRRRPTTIVMTTAGSLAALGLAAPAAHAARASTAYDVVGVAHIAASDTRVGVRRTTFTARFAADGRFRGSLPVPPTRAHFTLFGQPAVVTVHFVASGALTGSEFPTASGPALTGTGRYVVRLSDLIANGQPIDLGPDCRTITPVTMSASTPPGATWDRAAGGTISGSFTVGGFQTCGNYERAIDSTISGAGNDLTLRLRAHPTGS